MENPLNKRIDELESKVLDIDLKYDNIINHIKILMKSIKTIEDTFDRLMKQERR